MRRYFTLPLLLMTTAVMAQSGAVKLHIVDAESGNDLVGAVVSLAESSEPFSYDSTRGDGVVTFNSVKYGEYKLVATFLGYDTLRRNVVVDRELVDLGSEKMAFRSRVLDRVKVQTNSIRTSQSGDTVIYNADSFKVASDAVVEGLLAKMPGITVNDGEVEAQGEEVKRIYLDGKEYFGEDVALAVKNIPADIIEGVEVFNKLSDSAEFTGFDDGDSYKAINIITRKGMNQGQFGKFEAGYGYDDLYQASVNYSYFKGNHRITVVGSSNNMNIKGFSAMDVSGGRGGGGGRESISGGGSFMSGSGSTNNNGLTTQTGIGFNYTGQLLDERLKMEVSYFYNDTDNDIYKTTDRTYITDVDDPSRYYNATSNATTSNLNHRVNTKFEFKPNARHMIMMRPEFVYQNNDVQTIVSDAVNSESEDGGVTLTELNTLNSDVSSLKDAFTVSNRLIYRVLVGNKGRNLTLHAYGSYSQNDNTSLSDYLTDYPSAVSSLIKQQTLNDFTSYTINSSVMYAEPILDKKAQLTATYSANYKYSDSDYRVYDWLDYLEMYNPDYDEDASNIYDSGYLTQKAGPGIMYSKAKSLQLNANIYFQHASLVNDQQMPEVEDSRQSYNFDNVVYNMMLRKTFNPTNTLRLMVRSSTSNPSVSNLQTVIDDSNPQSVTYGNPDLVPSYTNMIRATYTRSSTNKGRTFMAQLSGNYAMNAISDNTVMLLNEDDSYTLPNGEQLSSYGEYTTPVNMDGDWNISSTINFGLPVNFLYSNLNTSLSVNYSETPSILNGLDYMSRTTYYKGGLSLGSNISENVDFTLAYRGGYNVAKYDTVEGVASQDNNYLTHEATANFKFVIWKTLTLSGDGSYTQYKGITDDFDEQYLLCNVYVGTKLFKSKRGELTLGVYDVFDQTESFARNITESYMENVISNSIGRYYGIKLSFDLRKFNGVVPQMGGDRPPRDGGGMGGPPPGMF